MRPADDRISADDADDNGDVGVDDADDDDAAAAGVDDADDADDDGDDADDVAAGVGEAACAAADVAVVEDGEGSIGANFTSDMLCWRRNQRRLNNRK